MEKWRDIPGYEGIYEASNEGRIKTKLGKTTQSVLHGTRHWKQRILKQKIQQQKNGRRDARVCLWRDKSEKTMLVARLVALAWVDGYKDGMTVNHIDGDSMNNKASNLEWVSIKENIRHGFKNGAYAKSQRPVVMVFGEGIKFFDSMSDASRAIGKNPKYISMAYNRYKSKSSR